MQNLPHRTQDQNEPKNYRQYEKHSLARILTHVLHILAEALSAPHLQLATNSYQTIQQGVLHKGNGKYLVADEEPKKSIILQSFLPNLSGQTPVE